MLEAPNDILVRVILHGPPGPIRGERTNSFLINVVRLVVSEGQEEPEMQYKG
jgi:hypothetical protein